MMKSLLTTRRLIFVLGLCVLGLLIVSCSPKADDLLISPQLGAQLAAQSESGALPTPTPIPSIKDLTPDQLTAGLPDDIAKALKTANPDNALKLAQANGCAGCHSLDPNVKLAGPTWVNVGDTAVGRRPGMSPAAYFYQSITDPSAYVVEGFNDGVMPKNFKEKLSAEQLADIIAFLLKQHK
jgi:cytochrome c551/c552